MTLKLPSELNHLRNVCIGGIYAAAIKHENRKIITCTESLLTILEKNALDKDVTTTSTVKSTHFH